MRGETGRMMRRHIIDGGDRGLRYKLQGGVRRRQFDLIIARVWHGENSTFQLGARLNREKNSFFRARSKESCDGTDR